MILLAVLAFYSRPLFSTAATIQGDTADVHYPLQKYFADRLFSGHLPFWTPYIFAGYPVLSNPLMGAWYPLNWPFFLFGVTPAAVQWELAIHAGLACLGTYFYLRRLLQWRSSAMLGAFAYGLSGFFAVQSAHLAVFVAAAWFPWLLLAYRRAIEGQKLRYTALGGFVGGLILLGGHLQAAIFCFAGLMLVALAEAIARTTPWTRAGGIAIAMIAGALALSAVELMPAGEISSHLTAPRVENVTAGDRVLQGSPIATLVWPPALPPQARPDRGPSASSYFYGGILLLPIAVIGLLVTPMRARCLLLTIPAIWFMLGPSAGLYRLGAILPPAQSAPPVFAWFLVAFALALLAGAGSDWIASRNAGAAMAAMALVGFFFADLWYWNLWRNPLAFARQSYQAKYGRLESLGRRVVARPQLGLSRFDCSNGLFGMGPLLHPLDMKFETTYGYLLPEAVCYRQYRDAMLRNAHLRDGLNVSRYLDLQKGGIEENISVLPRAYFPSKVREVNSEAESQQALANLQPSDGSTVLPPHEAIDQDANAEALVNSFDEQSYRIHYTAQTPSLLKLSVPWYPGWHASVGQRNLKIVRVDHALMGVVVPEGEHDIDFWFAPRWFYPGAVTSVFAAMVLGLVAAGGQFYRRMDSLLFRKSGWKRRRRRHSHVSSI